MAVFEAQPPWMESGEVGACPWKCVVAGVEAEAWLL